MDLVAKIDAHLEQARPRRERTAHSAYDVGACGRQLYYKWTGESETRAPEAKNRWAAEIGDSLHEMFVRILNEMGVPTVVERTIEKRIDGLDNPFRARIDVEIVDDGIVKICDLKSMYGRAVKAIQSDGPKIEHVKQLAVYMGLTGIRHGILIYFARDHGYRTQFEFEVVDAELRCSWSEWDKPRPTGVSWADLIKRMQVLEGYLRRRELPPRDYLAAIKDGVIRDYQYNSVKYKSDWQCSYCDWSAKCWADDLRKYADSNNSEVLNDSPNAKPVPTAKKK